MSPAGRRPLPPPPPDLDARSLPLIRYDGPLFRVHRLSAGALQPSALSRRFSAPGLGFETLYAATDDLGAFAETVLPRFDGTFAASGTFLQERAMAVMACTTPLTLVDLTDDGLGALRTDARICTTDDYSTTQQWARAFHRHPSKPDGLFYLACSAPQHRSAALFDRAIPRLALLEDKPFKACPDLLDRLADKFHLAIIPD